jgi:hypothetical protein
MWQEPLGHEIFLYFRFGPGGHNNAFSPENLPSSFLGTMVGVKALRSTLQGGDFNAAVTRELNTLVSGARPVTKAETLNAFNRINGCWVKFRGPADTLNQDYLLRRNFTLLPWKTGHPADVPTPASIFPGFGNAEQFYAYTYTNTLGQPIPKSSSITPATPIKFNYSTEIARIRFDAWKRYGYNLDPKYGYYFDQPSPCPPGGP